jgi:hypothetical protein
MSERSMRCPDCPFSFARLVDAGDFHAYVCPDCGWTKPTTDRRPGNRPADVCALCDTPIALRGPSADHHLYIGPGWVHGGGREYAPIHRTCGRIDHLDEGVPLYFAMRAVVAERLGVAS